MKPFLALSHPAPLNPDRRLKPTGFNNQFPFNNISGLIVAALLLGLTPCTTLPGQEAATKVPPLIDIVSVELKPGKSGHQEAVIILKNALPVNGKEKKFGIRFLFVRDEAKVKLDDAFDINGPADINVRLPWMTIGGFLSKAGQTTGFVVDVFRATEEGWTTGEHNQIVVPLSEEDRTLLPGMDKQLAQSAGKLYIAFLALNQAGGKTTSNAMSNTHHIEVQVK